VSKRRKRKKLHKLLRRKDTMYCFAIQEPTLAEEAWVKGWLYGKESDEHPVYYGQKFSAEIEVKNNLLLVSGLLYQDKQELVAQAIQAKIIEAVGESDTPLYKTNTGYGYKFSIYQEFVTLGGKKVVIAYFYEVVGKTAETIKAETLEVIQKYLITGEIPREDTSRYGRVYHGEAAAPSVPAAPVVQEILAEEIVFWAEPEGVEGAAKS